MTQRIVVNSAQQRIAGTTLQQRIVVNTSNKRVTVTSPPPRIVLSKTGSGGQGPPGPQGPPGVPGGGSGAAMNFEQTTISGEWIINHNFGFFPNVDLYTAGGVGMVGQVVNVTNNQVRVYFTTPVAGSARLT